MQSNKEAHSRSVDDRHISHRTMSGVVFSKDGTFFAVCLDTSLKVFETVSSSFNSFTYKLRGNARCIDISSDQKMIAVGCDEDEGPWIIKNRTSCIIDVESHLEIMNLPPSSSVRFSPDCTLVATADIHYRKVGVTDISSGRTVYSPEVEQPRSLTFSPDGTRLAFISKYDVITWNIVTNTTTRFKCRTPDVLGNDDRVEQISFLPCGNFVVGITQQNLFMINVATMDYRCVPFSKWMFGFDLINTTDMAIAVGGITKNHVSIVDISDLWNSGIVKSICIRSQRLSPENFSRSFYINSAMDQL